MFENVQAQPSEEVNSNAHMDFAILLNYLSKSLGYNFFFVWSFETLNKLHVSNNSIYLFTFYIKSY